MPETPLQRAWADWAGARQAWQDWFLSQALPLWRDRGVDRQHGGFHEKLDASACAREEPRRTRVVARQLYVFATAPSLGDAHDAQPLIDHGLDFLLGHLLSDSDTFHAAYAIEPRQANTRFDLYEQAFGLFALGAVYQRSPSSHPDLPAQAERILQRLQSGWRHPDIGFQESQPPSPPLRSNPHMHLLEAALCWQQAMGHQAESWNTLVHQLVTLCLHKLVQRPSGLVTELFDLDWAPLPGPDGELVEPGHQFEWGWLLMSWAGREPSHPLAEAAVRAAEHMIRQGEALGVDVARGVAINALGTSGEVRDASAKLWPQTERIKAWVAMAQTSQTDDALTHALACGTRAIRGLMRYFQHPLSGAWHESLGPDDRWQLQDTRASSLYHIVCALAVASELQPPKTSASASNGAEASLGASKNPG
jgi:mannose-6-phosphate isomerase